MISLGGKASSKLLKVQGKSTTIHEVWMKMVNMERLGSIKIILKIFILDHGIYIYIYESCCKCRILQSEAL